MHESLTNIDSAIFTFGSCTFGLLCDGCTSADLSALQQSILSGGLLLPPSDSGGVRRRVEGRYREEAKYGGRRCLLKDLPS